MKKGVLLLSILIIFSAFFFNLIIAAGEIKECSDGDDNCKVDNAYTCLENVTEEIGCGNLSLEQKTFTLLAIKDCEDELTSDSQKDSDDDNLCWPDTGNCRIKSTAQAILALDNVNTNTDEAEDWLLSQNTTPTSLQWFLQIESPRATTCSITYDGSSHDITIGSDKKINTNAGSCLTLSDLDSNPSTENDNDYWLKVSRSCYDNEFEVVCDEGFLTSLLFKKTNSPTIHVSEGIKTSSSNGMTPQKVNSLCFEQGSACDYEGSLWAAMVLDYKDHDISPFLPYLITMADESENQEFIPEAFLTYLLKDNSDFKNDLLGKQKNPKNEEYYWQESTDRYYDTAVALLPFLYDSYQEKTNSINWLLDEAQDESGCWNGNNVRDTAFLLYSIWPDGASSGGGSGGGGGGGNDSDIDNDCETDGDGYCMSGADCEGETLSDFYCSGSFKCCDTEKTEESCSQQGGEVCSSSEDCVGGRTEDTFDLSYGEDCCLGGGTCKVPAVSQENECKSYGGECRSSGCNADEDEEYNYDCEFTGDSCCFKSSTTTSDEKSYLWVWILLTLIVLVILGIVFRDQLRPLWFRIKSSFGGSGRGGSRGPGGGFRPGFPPRRPPMSPMGRPMPPRRILPPQQYHERPAPHRSAPVKQKSSGELDDVLKKLKEMGG